MEKQQFNKEEQTERSIHNSINVFRIKKNNISIEQNKDYMEKRSSSMLLNSSLNFVPKLKPIKAIISPSPINLNQKCPPNPIPEINTTMSTASFDSQNDSNLNIIKKNNTRRYRPKKSFKFLNIEEETYAMSDYENSDPAKSYDEGEINLNKYNINNNKYGYFFNNIKVMRKSMAKIRKSFVSNESLLDDSKIENHFVGKRFNHFKNINQDNFINTIRRKKILNPLKKIKYRTKSFSIKRGYVSTILGFLEKNNSTISLNSNGK